ncbi:MAG: FHA domain-containing protein [Planctomycetota bacterium]|jgi:pSer/pThr/pTyr-binding forkhead associated (FHA) protein
MAKVTVTFSGEFVGEYPLDRPASIVGRDATCDIQIDNLGVSRAHCQFVKRGNTFILQDMNSANGTYVNGRKVGEHYLNDGDEVLVGKFLLKFDATGTAAPPEKPPEEKPAEVMGDALRTYVVDGAKIRERLAGMHEAETERQPVTTEAAPGEAPRQVGLPTPPPGPRRAADHALDFDPLKPRTRPGTQHLRRGPEPAAAGGASKVLLFMSLFINLVLIALVVVLIVMMQKITSRIERVPSTGGGPAVSAPAVAPEVGD